MKGWFSSISSGGNSEKSIILPLLMMKQIYSLQHGQVEWCLHHVIKQGMQKLCPHSRDPNSYSVVDRQIVHFSVVLSATSTIFFILLATRGLIKDSVLLEDAPICLSLLISVGHFLERLRVYLRDVKVLSWLFKLASIGKDLAKNRVINYEFAQFSQLL